MKVPKIQLCSISCLYVSSIVKGHVSLCQRQFCIKYEVWTDFSSISKLPTDRQEVAKSSFDLKHEVVFCLNIICYSWSQYGNGEWTWTSWVRYLWHTIIFWVLFAVQKIVNYHITTFFKLSLVLDQLHPKCLRTVSRNV